MSNETRPQVYATDRDLPTPNTQNLYTPQRGSRFGEPWMQAIFGTRLHALAEEGSLFSATNPTPGTGITGIAAADGYDQTEGLLHLRNPSSTKTLYLLALELHVTAVGTNGTNFAYAMTADKGTTRHSSGGSTITPVNANIGDSTQSEAVLKFGALVLAAATADARLIDHGHLRSVIKVVNDKYRFVFGGSEPGLFSGLATAGTAEDNQLIVCPPVVLPPGIGAQFMLHEFSASQTVGAGYQFKALWAER